jgi:hypothetical protein
VVFASKQTNKLTNSNGTSRHLPEKNENPDPNMIPYIKIK